MKVTNFGPEHGADIIRLRVAGGIVSAPNPAAVVQQFVNADASLAFIAGDVVVITSAGVVSTTTAQDTRPIGVVLDDIAVGDTGPVQTSGYTPFVHVTASVTANDYAETSTTAKAATQNATRRKGSFGIYLSSGTTPDAMLFGSSDLNAAGGGSGGTALPWFMVTNYGATGNGTTDDTAAINLAIAALIAAGKGVLYFPAGTYKVTGALTTISVPCLILGDGSADYQRASPISEIRCTSQTAVLFTVTTDVAKFLNISLANTYAGTPSAGAGIQVSGGTIAQRCDYDNVMVTGFYINVDVQVGNQWTMRACQIIGPVVYGLKIRNTVNSDAGDWSITETSFDCRAYNATSAIRQESSGGGRLINVKINQNSLADVAIYGTKQYVTGVDVAIGTGGTTSILLLTNVSIENVSGDAFSFVTSGSGTFDKVGLVNCEVFLGNNTGSAVKASGAGLTVLSIDDTNFFRTSGTARAAISLTNVSNIRIGAPRLEGFNAIFTSSGTSNVLDATGAVAAGVAITGTPISTQVPIASSGTAAPWGTVTATVVDFSADVTNNNVTTGHHGLAPKGDGDASHYLDGTLGWTTPAGSGGGSSGSGGASAIAYSSGDVTATGSLQDVTGCAVALAAGTYIVAGDFDVLVNSALNDRTFEGHLDVGGSDQTNIATFVGLGLVNDRDSVVQFWRIVLASTTTVKLRTKYSGGTTGDFTVKAQSSISAFSAYGVNVVPTIVAVGTSATSAGGNVTPGLPTGHTTNDILYLFAQSDQQALTAPSGYVQFGPAFGLGTAAAASATRGYIFWKRDGGSESAPTITGAADHTLAQIMAVRGCPTVGDPHLSVGQTRKAVASTTGTGAAGATPVDACLVVQTFVHALDSASAVFSGWTNANLTSITEQIDVGTADGNGGGIGVATGIAATAGSFVATTVTETSTVDCGFTFICLPSGITARAGFVDRQVFLTPGLADTWTKPTDAETADVVALGGGASGSGGRNGSVAAGGGGGGGGMYTHLTIGAAQLPATMTITAGAGGAITANSDGAASNVGNASTVVASGVTIQQANAGNAAGASATGSGGLGGNGGGVAPALAAGTATFSVQQPGGGTGGTTALGGGAGNGDAGGAGAGGGTTQAASAGGASYRGGGGGGGGRSNTTVGTGGPGVLEAGAAGGATAGAVGADSPYPEFGGAGGAGGTSGTGDGGAGGWPGGGGGGGGSQSGHVTGGKGGDGTVVVTTVCG